jgi:hypothetical protein
VLELDRDEPLGNCSLTRYRRGEDGRLGLVAFADTSHLASSAVEETHESSAAGQDHG